MGIEQIRSDWTRLGSSDPLWAVLATPDRRHGQWDREAFLATGRAEVGHALTRAAALGMVSGGEQALDFGCGAGRLSVALADHVHFVVGVDISPPMLAKARELDDTGRCEFVENDRPDLRRFADGQFDIAFSSLVLQHIPPTLARTYLAELVRVLRPGGSLIVQFATAPDRSARGWLVRLLPLPTIRFAQRRLLRYPAPMDMHPVPRAVVTEWIRAAGGELRDAVDEPMYGGNWHYTRYFVTRP